MSAFTTRASKPGWKRAKRWLGGSSVTGPCPAKPAFADPGPELASSHRLPPSLAWQCMGGSGCLSAPRAHLRGLHTPIYALYIQQLLPHYSKGLQPYYYLKNGSKQLILRLFLPLHAASDLLKTLKLCEFMYLSIFTH